VIDPGLVSAVLVTRGDQDLTPIYDTIDAAGIKDVVTYDNSLRPDRVCYGRYLAISEARNPMIYFQDDDLTLDVGMLLDCWRFGLDTGILANNRIDEEWPLIGIGSLFHRDAADCFTEYLSVYPEDREFYRTCDVVFGYLHFPSGLVAHLHVSWLDPHKSRKLTVVGSEGMAVFDDTEADRKLTVYEKASSPSRFDTWGEFQALRTGDVKIPQVPNAEPLIQETKAFVDAILAGKATVASGE
jgi:hypothetical protein